MARIQILELPMVHVGDTAETPFALVIDQADEATLQHLAFGITVGPGSESRPTREAVAELLGARTVLAFADTIEIPANTLMDDDLADRIRALHRPVEYHGHTICAECSAYADGSTDNAPIALGDCRTLRILEEASCA